MVRPGVRGVKGLPAPTSGEWVVLALGSNLGDRDKFLVQARRGLQLAGFSAVLASAVEQTDPVGGPAGQGPFLNQILAAPRSLVALTAQDLLDAALAIERSAGRERRERWGPRTLDIDLLLFGAAVIESRDLVVPHPRLAERAFVLEPLARLLPDVVHPVLGATMRELAERLRLPSRGSLSYHRPPGTR